MMAVVIGIAEQCTEKAGKWVHFGATSNDILDTSTGLQIKDAIEILENKMEQLRVVLVKHASDN